VRRETQFRKVDLVGSALEHGPKARAVGRTRGVADEMLISGKPSSSSTRRLISQVCWSERQR
jgi:hypothetical protein